MTHFRLYNDNTNSEIIDCSILIEDDEIEEVEEIENPEVYYDDNVIPVGGLEEISQSDIIETTVFVSEESNESTTQQLEYPHETEILNAYGLEQDPLAENTTNADVITIDDDPPDDALQEAIPRISVAKNLTNNPIQNDSINYKDVFKCRNCSKIFDSATAFMAHQMEYLAKQTMIPGLENTVSTNTPTVTSKNLSKINQNLTALKKYKIPSSLNESQQPKFIFVPHNQNTPGVNINDLMFVSPQSSTVPDGSAYVSGLSEGTSPAKQVFGSAKVLSPLNRTQYFPELVPLGYKPGDPIIAGPLPAEHSAGVLYMNGNQVFLLPNPNTNSTNANIDYSVDNSFVYMPSAESATSEIVSTSTPSKITLDNLSHYQAEFVSKYLPQNIKKTLSELHSDQVNPITTKLAKKISLLKSQKQKVPKILKKQLSTKINKKDAPNIVINGKTYKLLAKSGNIKPTKRVPPQIKGIPSVNPENQKSPNDAKSIYTPKYRGGKRNYLENTEKNKKSVVVTNITPVASNDSLDNSIVHDIQMPKITNVMSVEGESAQSDSITIITDDDSNSIATIALDNVLSQSSDDIESSLPMSLIVRENHANDIIDLG